MAGHGNEVYRVQGLGERRHRSKNIKNKEKYKIGERGRMGANPNFWVQNIPHTKENIPHTKVLKAYVQRLMHKNVIFFPKLWVV